MKRSLRLVGVAAMMLLLAASCKKDENNNDEKQMMTFTAGIEQGDSKTGLLPNGSHCFRQVWTENDAIMVNGDSFNLEEGCEGKETGTFSGELAGDAPFYAIYPANAALNGSNATFNLPATQSYVEKSYSSNLAPMAAMSQTSQLKFKNLCGLMELGLIGGEDITVTSLELSCNEPICGQTKAYDMTTLATNEPATLEMAGTGKKITMTCGSGIELGETSTSFIFVLPPLEDGNFSLKVYYEKDDRRLAYVQTINLPEGISIEASKVVYNSFDYAIGVVRTENVTDFEADPTTMMNVTYSVDEISEYRIIEHGVCYSTSENPDMDGNGTKVKYEGTEPSSPYHITITGLTPGTRYYVRAYAIYEPEAKSGSRSTITIYGNEFDHTTSEIGGIVTTVEVVDGTVTATGANVKYTVEPNSISRADEHGVCYGTSENPDLTGSHTIYQGEGSSPYTITISDSNLTPNTKYYVRAYAKFVLATREVVTVYGGQKYFTTPAVTPSIPEGALPGGVFTVNAQGKQVRFSKGNLWCDNSTPAAPVWYFENNQYDFHTFGTTANGMVKNGVVSKNDANTWGLFAWSCENHPYGMLTESSSSGFDAVFVDWGNNPISNGGNNASQYKWRTLEAGQMDGGEWEYLLVSRSGNRFAYAQVCGVNGLVIFPDGWVSSSSYTFSNINTAKKAYTDNTINATAWETLHEEGCVFLPTVGEKNTSGSWVSPTYGYYWANGTPNSGNNAKCMTFGSTWKPGDNSSARNWGMSVRLVIDVPSTNN